MNDADTGEVEAVDIAMRMHQVQYDRANRVTAERDAALAEVERHGPCTCTSGPDIQGPDERCPRHGHTFHEVLERGDILQERAHTAKQQLDALVTVIERQIAEWDAAASAAQHRCSRCGEQIMDVEPFRLYAHIPDMLGYHVHVATGESFCHPGSSSDTNHGRATPSVFTPDDPLASLRRLLDAVDAEGGDSE